MVAPKEKHHYCHPSTLVPSLTGRYVGVGGWWSSSFCYCSTKDRRLIHHHVEGTWLHPTTCNTASQPTLVQAATTVDHLMDSRDLNANLPASPQSERRFPRTKSLKKGRFALARTLSSSPVFVVTINNSSTVVVRSSLKL